MSTAVLSCDYSIWFINWNRCVRTGGHSHAREGLQFTTGSNMMKYHHWHWGPLADLTEEPKRCSQRKKRMTALNMNVFSSPNLTYGRWKILKCHLPWWVTASESTYWMRVVLHSIALKEKRGGGNLPFTSFKTKLVQIRSTATSKYVAYTISKAIACHICLPTPTNSKYGKNFPFLLKVVGIVSSCCCSKCF